MVVKKNLLLTICFISISCACFAQDIIVTKDSRKIKANVLEVNIDNIRYKNFENEDEIVTIPKSDVVTILFQNRHVDTFVSEKTRNQYVIKKPTDLLFDMETQNSALYQEYKNYEKIQRKGNKQLAVGGFNHHWV